MTEADWQREDAHSLGVFLNGREIPAHDRRGNPIRGASFLICFNAHHEPLDFLIAPRLGRAWTVELSTAADAVPPDAVEPGATVSVHARSILVLRRRAGNGRAPS